jgi:hypothetical protein
MIRKHGATAEKLTVGVAQLETYIRPNQESIPNLGERYRQGEQSAQLSWSQLSTM